MLPSEVNWLVIDMEDNTYSSMSMDVSINKGKLY